MLELKSYTDDELIDHFKIAPSTLKSKRKVTEGRLLKNYEWSRDKKKKLYTIHAYKVQSLEDSLLSTFDSLIHGFTSNQVPLKNLEKALRILVTLYYTDENFPSVLALIVDETPLEVSRYVKKFQLLDILVKEKYDYYLIDEEDLSWEKIDKIQYERILSFWSEEFFKGIDKFKVSALEPDEVKLKLCKEIASYKTVEEYGFLRKVTKKDLTEEAKEYFGPFLRFSNEQMRLMFKDSIPSVD